MIGHFSWHEAAENVNLVGVNNACDNGPQLVQVLRERLNALEKIAAAGKQHWL